MKKKVLAIIPARANSKGVKNKNIKIFKDKPLIEHTISFVKDIGLFDEIIVSSDSLKIKKISNKKKIKFHERPKSLALDDSKIEDTILYTLDNLTDKDTYEYVFLFEPTTPFRKKKTVIDCFKILKKNNINSVFTVCRSNKYYGKVKNNNFFPLALNQQRRRQDRESLFFECGSVYCFKVNNFLKQKKIIDHKSYAFEIDEIEALDINSENDFLILNSLSRKL